MGSRSFCEYIRTVVATVCSTTVRTYLAGYYSTYAIRTCIRTSTEMKDFVKIRTVTVQSVLVHYVVQCTVVFVFRTYISKYRYAQSSRQKTSELD